MSRIAILGVGKVGTAIARAAMVGGHEVTLAGSGSPEPVQFIVDVLAPGARVDTTANAVAGSDLVILAIPLPKVDTLDPEMFAGRIVVDAMNHWEPTDGALPALFAGAGSTSEVVAGHLHGARVVKALNHIGYHEMEADARPAGSPDRRGLAAVSDDLAAAQHVAELVASFGFDLTVAVPLSLGAQLEPGSEIFGGSFSRAEIDERLTAIEGAARIEAAAAASIRAPQLTVKRGAMLPGSRPVQTRAAPQTRQTRCA